MDHHVILRAGMVVRQIIDARRAVHPRHDPRDDIVDMNAAEDLIGQIDAPRPALPDPLQHTATGSVDAGEAEDVHRPTQRLPCEVRGGAGAAPATPDWRGLIKCGLGRRAEADGGQKRGCAGLRVLRRQASLEPHRSGGTGRLDLPSSGAQPVRQSLRCVAEAEDEKGGHDWSALEEGLSFHVFTRSAGP